MNNNAVQTLARLSALEPSTARRELKLLLVAMINEFLKRAPNDSIGLRDRFIDAGFDSLRALDFKTRLEEQLLCTLEPTLLFDCPTPEALITFLADRVLDLPAPKETAPAAVDEGLAEELDRVAKMSEEEVRLLLARNTHRLRRLESDLHQPIAIIGMACRFPDGIDTPEALWRLFDEGRSAVTEIDESRWPMSQFYHPDRSVPGKINARRAAMLKDHDQFDARFFNISPREANELDPQQRMILEVTWEALERANIPASGLYGTPVGVFLGIRSSEYHDSQSGRTPEESTAYRATGNSLSTAAGRVSYIFGFTGPCFPVDTACSSSLVSIHLAVQSLRRGECSIAVAGGANTLIDPHTSIGLAKANMLAPDGKCKTFDASADGYVRAEGCTMFVLKTLARARADGDRINAVIRGTAINQDGASGGLTVPSGPAQEAVVRNALADAQVQPYQVGFIETHGTGTELGDPIEVTALENVFGRGERFHKQPLFVGAGKTNHGHMEAGAGSAALLKTVLTLENERIPKNLYFENPNPKIPWDRIVVKVPAEPVEWRRGSVARIAGVSSFGFSGTNSHAIVEEAPLRRRPRRTQRPGGELITLSARADTDLARLAASYADYLGSRNFELADVARTTALGRSHQTYRASIVATDKETLIEGLRSLAERKNAPGLAQGTAPAVEPAAAFLFTGQGSQKAGMGRDLYESERIFRDTLDRCAAVLDPRLGVRLVDVLWGQHTARLDDTRYTQPAMVAYQLALASLWESWGIRPRWVLGHSIGEISAACVAGALTFEQALIIAEARGRLMDGLSERGSMAAIQASAEEVEAVLARHGEGVGIAAYNGPKSIVISGRTKGVQAIAGVFEERGARVVGLTVSHAFHSLLMDPMLETFRAVVQQISGQKPVSEWISTLDPANPPAENADYWVRHVREPVRFADGMKRLAEAGCNVFLEVGPSTTLLAMGRSSVSVEGARWIASQQGEGHGRGRMLSALGQLYAAGFEPEWSNLFGDESEKIDLPTYPFSRRRHWLERLETSIVGGEELHPLLGVELPVPPLSGGEHIYSNHLSERRPPYLKDHRVGDGAIFPGAGYVELALALAAVKKVPQSIRDLSISTAMALDERGRQVATIARENSAEVKSRVKDGAWTPHASWSFDQPGEQPPNIDLEAVMTRAKEELPVDEVYKTYAERGLSYGPAFQGLRKVLLGEGEVLAQVAVPLDPRSFVHASVLDACFQAAGTLLLDREEMFLPVGVRHATLHRPLEKEVWCRATIAAEEKGAVVFDLCLYDSKGQPAFELKGLKVLATSSFRSKEKRSSIHSTTWVEASETTTAAERSVEGRVWVVLANGDELADRFVWLLDEQGARVTSLRREQIDLQDRTAIDKIFSELDSPCTDLVYLWALDDPPSNNFGDTAVHAHRLRGLIEIVQAAIRAGGTPPRLGIVTRGAQQIGESSEVLDVSQTPLWGFAAALAQEVPAMDCRCVDLSSADGRDASRLFQELSRIGGERRVAWRGERRYVARLIAGLDPSGGLSIPRGPGFELRTSGYGTLKNLELRAKTPVAPAAGEVQIEVAAAALNFKDVLHAMGLLKEWSERRGIHRAEDQPLGLECAGRVSAVGEGVAGFVVGDEVVALTDGTMASHVTVPAKRVAKKPASWSLNEAAGLQTVFFTAAYSLLFLAKIRPGERVLVQSAAGGVGQAAVQICKWIGAKVYATASEAKWSHLREQGVEHVMNSRSFEYSEEILRLTEGRGVDVVLNSLNEEHIPKSLAALGKGGRFIDIGKVGVWEPAKMAEARPDVIYHTFDLGELIEGGLEHKELMARVAPGFAGGQLRAIPTRVFKITQASEAFQLLASGKTIGKVVLEMPSREERDPRAKIRADRSYIISGGLGALGMETASWLAQRGAGAIVLLGRGEPKGKTVQGLEALRSAGTRVEILRVDVADAKALEPALDALIARLPPVGGVIHAAGVLADALIDGVDWSRAWTVMAPKVAGGWNLHRWSAKRDLDWFVSYASVASVFGSAGQTTYAAANAFLAGLAQERRRLGLPGTSVHWGSWSGGGMASMMPRKLRERMRRLGLHELKPADAFDALDRVLAAKAPEAVVASVAWSNYLSAVPAEAQTFLTKLSDESGSGGGKESAGLRSALLAAAPEARAEMLLGFTRRQLAAIVGMRDPNEITAETRFAELGMDSLLALDFRTLLERGLGTTLSTAMVFDHPTLGSLVTHVAKLLPGSEKK